MNSSASDAATSLSPGAILLIQLALALGGFAIGTGEFAIMGLMPNVAADLGVSEPQVGHVISAYALGVVVGAPVLALLGARLPRRILLLLLMGCFASATSPALWHRATSRCCSSASSPACRMAPTSVSPCWWLPPWRRRTSAPRR